jgi:hypothetical protein
MGSRGRKGWRNGLGGLVLMGLLRSRFRLLGLLRLCLVVELLADGSRLLRTFECIIPDMVHISLEGASVWPLAGVDLENLADMSGPARRPDGGRSSMRSISGVFFGLLPPALLV